MCASTATCINVCINACINASVQQQTSLSLAICRRSKSATGSGSTPLESLPLLHASADGSSRHLDNTPDDQQQTPSAVSTQQKERLAVKIPSPGVARQAEPAGKPLHVAGQFHIVSTIKLCCALLPLLVRQKALPGRLIRGCLSKKVH